MRAGYVLALVAAFALSLSAQVETEIRITKRVQLSDELAGLASYGGLKESACDAAGNLFTPTARKYTSATNSVLRIAPDARTFTQFSIDPLPQLQTGDIQDWALGPQGDLFVLAREVLKYSEEKAPLKFGDTFIVHWDKSGKLVSQLRIAIDGKRFTPSSLALLDAGQYLVVGYVRHGYKQKVLAQIFGADGVPLRKLNLSPKATTTSNNEAVASSRVYQPAALNSGGLIYVLRGSTREQVFVISGSGQLTRMLPLKEKGLEFDSPHIAANDLIVHAHPELPEETEPPQFHLAPARVNLPVFDLRTGGLVEEYYWYEPMLALVCYARDKFTFIGEDNKSRSKGWEIVHAAPGSGAKPRRSRATVIARRDHCRLDAHEICRK